MPLLPGARTRSVIHRIPTGIIWIANHCLWVGWGGDYDHFCNFKHICVLLKSVVFPRKCVHACALFFNVLNDNQTFVYVYSLTALLISWVFKIELSQFLSNCTGVKALINLCWSRQWLWDNMEDSCGYLGESLPAPRSLSSITTRSSGSTTSRTNTGRESSQSLNIWSSYLSLN